MKYTLALNSHQLSNFQLCETKYLYSELIRIQPIEMGLGIRKGNILGRWLNLYYYNKIKPRTSFGRVLYNPMLWIELIKKELNWGPQDAFKLYAVLTRYGTEYKNESWHPVAIEKGFSKILYEDAENLFVYEGRIDLLVENEGKLLVVDHKSQKMNYSIYEFNNQAIGYLWGCDAAEFVYNYLTLTKDPKFHRAVHPFNSGQIEAWKQNTIKWFFRVKEVLQKREFLPSLNCSTKFGVCDFHRICEQPNELVKLHIIRSNFKKKIYKGSW